MSCAMVSFALATVANAASVLIVNHSFESPTVADGSSSLAPKPSGTFNGWGYTMTVGSSFQDFGIENPGGGQYTGAGGVGTASGADGTNTVFLNQGINGGVINIFQNLGALQPDTTYTLTVAIGQRLDRVNGNVLLGLLNAGAGETNPWANGTLLNSTSGVSSVSGFFQDFTVSFTTGSTVSNDLYIGAQYTGNGTIQASLDNFRLDATTIPEPGGACLAVLGVAGILGRRRRP